MLGEIDPTLAYAGSHGSERRWHDGALHLPVRAAGLDSVVAAFDRFAASRPGVLVEPKSYSVALHYRLAPAAQERSEEHTSELQSLMRISYAVFCLKKKNKHMK